MRLAVADPPYLGRGNRWYGDGRAHGGGRGRADQHPEASLWDDPYEHVMLAWRLVNDFDGFALAGTPATLAFYLPELPDDVHVMVWHRGNAIPSGSRIAAQWEPVIVRIPEPSRSKR